MPRLTEQEQQEIIRYLSADEPRAEEPMGSSFSNKLNERINP